MGSYKRGYTLRRKHQQLTPLHHQKHAGKVLGMKEKCPNALSMLGSLELQNDDWVEANDRFQAAKKASDENDSFNSSIAAVKIDLNLCVPATW
ncbi:hypothetical protein C5167_048788 [Papaver somniferum]|uniref:Uncharacterized protein n=1 Tax=Papaver somniferum TaxID=3469 RepID=A0A4Y7KMZ2_PAPSO|nr:hypothetical protein C5167_048788 [Papaver somniferum]